MGKVFVINFLPTFFSRFLANLFIVLSFFDVGTCK